MTNSPSSQNDSDILAGIAAATDDDNMPRVVATLDVNGVQVDIVEPVMPAYDDMPAQRGYLYHAIVGDYVLIEAHMGLLHPARRRSATTLRHHRAGSTRPAPTASARNWTASTHQPAGCYWTATPTTSATRTPAASTSAKSTPRHTSGTTSTPTRPGDTQPHPDNGRTRPVTDTEPTPIIPGSGSHRPGAVNVRLVCPPDVMDAALASLSDFYGEAWQPSARKPSRSSDGHLLQYGTLIVPVPAANAPQTEAVTGCG